MISEKVVIQNGVGLHCRPAAIFVETASRFKSRVTLQKDEIKVNGKSILSILTLAAEKGSTMTLTVEGVDEEGAFVALKAVLEGRYDEA